MNPQENCKPNSGLIGGQIIIPNKVENIIRLFLSKFFNIEWSGILFYDFEGSFQDESLKIICKDILLMDKGDSVTTSIDYGPEIASYIANHLELADCKLGLIHSHHSMATTFSGTDINTLQLEGRDRVHFVSLIVNNAGTYSAKITRRIKKQLTGDIIYETFNGESVKEPTTYEETSVEWAELEVIKENDELAEYSERAKEIDCKLKSKPKFSTPSIGTPYIESPTLFDDEDDLPFNKNSRIYDSKPSEIKNNTDLEKVYKSKTYKEALESAFKEIITGSVLLNHESKVDIEDWAKNMPKVYKRRFGSADSNEFNNWEEVYVPFVKESYINKIAAEENISIDDFDTFEDLDNRFTKDLSDKLSKLPQNEYLKVIDTCLYYL